MDMTLKFNMGGVASIEQDIGIVGSYTPSEIVSLLNSGDIITSIREGGGVFDLTDDFRRIGTVRHCEIEHDLEYSEFKLL